jgi:epoxyqueuosine reductase
MTVSERVKAKASALGFSHVGIARAEPLGEEAGKLNDWLSRGHQATMAWMARNGEKRADVRLVLPGARSVIAVALNYYTGHTHSSDPSRGKISRYAWGDDYHDIVLERLEALRAWLETEFPGERGLAYVDTGPIMEKVWAQRAGIGWMGKHTNLITQEIGSWVFLGELITTLELTPDEPSTDHCGTCTLCLEACPTKAIVEPYVVDSGRCISYLTIEHRGEFTEGESGMLDGWIYGCDICQDVCPWNQRFAAETDEERFQPREGNVAPVLREWESMSAEAFSEKFSGSAMRRAKWSGLLRNIRAVLTGRSGTPG